MPMDNPRLFHVQQIPQLISSLDRYDARLRNVEKMIIIKIIYIILYIYILFYLKEIIYWKLSFFLRKILNLI